MEGSGNYVMTSMDSYRARLEVERREIVAVGVVRASQRGNVLAQVMREIQSKGTRRRVRRQVTAGNRPLMNIPD